LEVDKRFATILAVIILLFVGVFVFNKNSGNGSNGGSSSTAQASNHVEGNNKKNVTLVEYGDYECPICYAYYQPVKQTVAQFNDDIHFQFRNLPLSSVHKNAFAGARAAEAAGMQGKYWEMHDKLYEQQDPNGQGGWVASDNVLNAYFVTFAQSLGLDVNKFKQDYSSQKVNDTINADLAAFAKTGQPMATPTFFLDGQYVDNGKLVDSKTGQPSVDKFAAVIKAEISKKNPGSNQ
jgi:protein-disulfide isomerase